LIAPYELHPVFRNANPAHLKKDQLYSIAIPLH